MHKKTPLGEVGEFGLIRRLAGAWETGRRAAAQRHRHCCFDEFDGDSAASRLRLGIGDDAAAIDVPNGTVLLSTTDMLVEDIHFMWSGHRARALGRKSMAASVSDIAAMGGLPGWAFLSVGVPQRSAVEDVEELYAGMGESATRFGFVLAGGDTVRSEKWIISVTMLGTALCDPIARSGGRPGDLIMVTGTVGDSAAGLHLLLKNADERNTISGDDGDYLLDRHLDPTPRLREALALARHGGVSAMIDISDGVASEVHHICRSSLCGARLEISRLPVSRQAAGLAGAAGMDVINWALYGGEDYELLFTTRPETAPPLIKLVLERTGTPVSIIGELTEEKEGITARGPDGRLSPLPSLGYNHFAVP